MAALELGLGGQQVLLIEVPHLLGEGRGAAAADEAGEEIVEVVDVADEQLAGALIAGGVDGLGEVDDDGAVGAHQDVEVGEVAVDDAGAEHANDLGEQVVEDPLRHGWLEGQVAEARCGLAVAVLDELHDEHAVDEVVGDGDADAGGLQAVDRVDLGGAPGGLVLGLAVARVLAHRPLVAAVTGLAAFGVLGAVLEVALLGLLVDLGDALLAAGDHEVDLGLLAAHQRTQHLLDDAVVHEGQKGLRGAHATAPLENEVPRRPRL